MRSSRLLSRSLFLARRGNLLPGGFGPRRASTGGEAKAAPAGAASGAGSPAPPAKEKAPGKAPAGKAPGIVQEPFLYRARGIFGVLMSLNLVAAGYMMFIGPQFRTSKEVEQVLEEEIKDKDARERLEQELLHAQQSSNRREQHLANRHQQHQPHPAHQEAQQPEERGRMRSTFDQRLPREYTQQSQRPDMYREEAPVRAAASSTATLTSAIQRESVAQPAHALRPAEYSQTTSTMQRESTSQNAATSPPSLAPPVSGAGVVKESKQRLASTPHLYSDEDMRKLLTWVLEERQKLQPADRAKRLQVDQEKALLKQLLRQKGYADLMTGLGLPLRADSDAHLKELLQWVLEERRKLKASSREEKRKIDQEKQLLKRYIRQPGQIDELMHLTAS